MITGNINSTSFSVYPYGEIVIQEPVYSYDYIRWYPSNISGTFYVGSSSYNLESYHGFFSSSDLRTMSFGNTDIVAIKTNVSELRSWTFSTCSLLQTADLPYCEDLYGSVFYDCSALTYVNLPICSQIGNWAFYNCKLLSQINAPSLHFIGDFAFHRCLSLRQLNFPNLNDVPMEAFGNCTFSEITLPTTVIIGKLAFANNPYLRTVNLPECYRIEQWAFSSCSVLSTLILGYSGVCVISSYSPFVGTDFSNGGIYVPSSLVDTYKSHWAWVSYSSWIKPISS